MSTEKLDVNAIEEGTNYRKTMDPAKVAELAESIRAVGIIQHPLVRKIGKRRIMVCGFRRLAAAKFAGLTQIEVVAREMSDAEVTALQLVENGDRENAHPQDEADALLLLSKTDSIEAICTNLGKKTSHVLGRLRLANLPEATKEAHRSGRLSLGAAIEIARLDNPQSQADATVEILKAQKEGTISARDAWFVVRRFVLKLDTAPFPTGDAKLVKAAGACSTCPKRSGNQTSLTLPGMDVLEDDVCTDAACFRSKVDANWAREEKAAQGMQAEILTDPETIRAIFGHVGTKVQGEDWAEPNDVCLHHPERVTWKKALNEHGSAARMTLAQDPSGGAHWIFRKSEALGVLERAGATWAAIEVRDAQRIEEAGQKPEKTTDPKETEKTKRKALLQRVANQAAEYIRNAIHNRYLNVDGDSYALAQKLDVQFLRLAFCACDAFGLAVNPAAKVLDLKLPVSHADALRTFFEAIGTETDGNALLVALVASAFAAPTLAVDLSWDPKFLMLCQTFDVDLAKVEAEVTGGDEVKAEKGKKAKAEKVDPKTGKKSNKQKK